MHTLLAITSVLAVTLVSGRAAAAQEAGEIVTESRSITTAGGEVIEYELGTLYVPENRSDPDSRLIGVGFARIPAAEPADVPPVFRLPGGPGSSMLGALKARNRGQRARAIASLAQFRTICDTVLVDQRGYSQQGGNLLMGSFESPPQNPGRASTLEDRISMFEAFAGDTAIEYDGSEVDLRGYTVIECAHDVDALREALGYEQIILNGTSFGSQWSFAVMKLHPDIVARALLSGVEPLDSGYDMPSYVFAAVQRMWRTIDADPRFKPFLPEGGMAAAAEAVIKRLENEPIKLERDGEVVGVLGPLDFPWNDPTQILELYHGRTDRWARQGSARGAGRNSMPLIAPLIDSSLGVTKERGHRLWTDPATRYLGRGNFALYMATAETWPSPDVGEEFRTPELCDIPVVFAQGDWDTQTPLENTFEIAPFFPNSRVIIAERGGHGVLGPIVQQHPKVGEQLMEFVRTGAMADLPARVRLQPSRSFSPPSFSPPR